MNACQWFAWCAEPSRKGPACGAADAGYTGRRREKRATDGQHRSISGVGAGRDISTRTFRIEWARPVPVASDPTTGDGDMSKTAKLELDGKVYELPVVVGSEGEKAIDISELRSATGYITLDDGYGNTGSCSSAITFIDGEKGILRYRGIPIEQLAEKSTFLETAYLIIYGHLPSHSELKTFIEGVNEGELIHEDMKYHFEGFPPNAPPMAILSAMINATSCFYPGLAGPASKDKFDVYAPRLISQVRTIAAFSYRKSRGLPIIYPRPNECYTCNFLHMMFSKPYRDYEPNPAAVKALDLIFLLHADHEQNCSTSTVRMVASSQANMFASAAAGVCALWGPLHGGANQAVIEMLQQIHDTGDDGSKFIQAAKDKASGKKLMGFGHRVYKNYDPRARIIKAACDELLASLHITDPLLDIAKRLESAALEDSYFVERKLYPNVDFYSGTIMRALGIPTEMFPVMFAIGRMPGWIANFKEILEDSKSRIYRPRQVFVGPPVRAYVPVEKRNGNR
jgi:citrate synthase